MTENNNGFNPYLEGEFIGSLFLHPEEIESTLEFVTPETYSHRPYRFVFEAMLDLNDDGIEITSSTVIHHLERIGKLNVITPYNIEGVRGKDAIIFLAEFPFDGDVPKPISLARQLQDVETTYNLKTLATEIEARAEMGVKPTEIIAFIDKEVGKMPMVSTNDIGKISDGKQAVSNFLDRYDRIARGEIEPYIDTGLSAIDGMIGGVGKGKVILIAGTSGDGKTTLAQNILNYIGVDTDKTTEGVKKTSTKKCAFIKMEGKEYEGTAKFIQFHSGIDSVDLEKGTVKDGDIPKMLNATGILEKSDLVISASPGGMTMRQLKNQIIKLHAMGVEIFVIDQLNNLELETDKSSYLDSDKKGYLIKKWADELDIGVIVIHQMNKGSNSVHRKGKFNVTLADLELSGEKAMDAVIFVRHDNEKTLIMIVKARIGRTGNVRVNFDPITSRYSDYASLPDAMSAAEYEESEK